MSWFQRLKNKVTGTPDDDGAPAATNAQRSESGPAKPHNDPEIAKLTAAIAALPDGPDKISAYLSRGMAYKKLEAFDLAITDLERVLKAVPQVGSLHADLGLCLLFKGENDLAMKSFDRAIALLEPGVPRALTHFNRANTSAAIGDFETVFAHLDKARKLAPEVADIATQERQRHLKLQASTDKKPQIVKPTFENWVERAWQLDQAGNLVDALVAFGYALDMREDHDALYGRGVVNCKLRRYPAAVADLNRAIELHPRFPAAITERGLAHVECEELDKGIVDYDAALAIDPSYALAHSNKGAVLCMKERWKEAIPYLDMAIRLGLRDINTLYNRSAAHEMLGDLPRAAHDIQMALAQNLQGPALIQLEKRFNSLRARIGDAKPWEPSPMERVFTQCITISMDDTVDGLLHRVHKEGAFFVVLKQADKQYLISSVYGSDGLRKRLTEIADVIGPSILGLRLNQIEKLLVPLEPALSQDKSNQERLVPGPHFVLVTEGERMIGVLPEGVKYHFPHLPTTIVGAQRIFERTDHPELARTCAECRTTLAYFDPKFDEIGLLIGYACGQCGASPTSQWIEERMRPSRWSRVGFLGQDESLRDIMAEDERKLRQLGLRAEEIANALDKILDHAFTAYEQRIAEATIRFEDELRSAGKRGVEGLALLPVGPSFDEIEAALRNGQSLAKMQGASIDGYDVFLQVYMGYQNCPWTMLRRPWCDEPPPLEITRRRVGNVVHLNLPTDLHLPCRTNLTYRYANLEFFLVKKGSREFLQGSGILVHLIRDHSFFEGKKTPFRLDPENTARFLGLL